MFRVLFITLLITELFVGAAFAQTNSQTIALKQGFNFISFTIRPLIDAAAFKAFDPSILEIYSYNAASGSFVCTADGTLSNITAGKGYIVKSSANKTLTISGEVVTTIGEISLKSGFNLIGISKTISTTQKFSDLMKSNTFIRGIYKWNASSGAFIQVIKDLNGFPLQIDNFDPTFVAGQAYFLNLENDTAMVYDGGSIVIDNEPVAMPQINPAGGSFSKAQSVSISCITKGATIKYTTDGSDPSATNGLMYSAPISIKTNTMIKAIAILMENSNSRVATANYIINVQWPDFLTIELGNGLMLEMVKIQATGKTFQMGSSDSEKDRRLDEGPLHNVSFSKDYYVGKYEVTINQWKIVMNGANPSYFNFDDNNPVEQVSWYDICNKGGFLEKLNNLNPDGYIGFRLPTEAEWEYAARGDTQTRFYWGDDLMNIDIDNYAWNEKNSFSVTHPVGQKLSNKFGLFDMNGNVWEWCQDNMHDDYIGAPADGSIPWKPGSGNFGFSYISRGGGWHDPASLFRSAFRGNFSAPSYRNNDVGFRLVLTSGQ